MVLLYVVPLVKRSEISGDYTQNEYSVWIGYSTYVSNVEHVYILSSNPVLSVILVLILFGIRP